ncbi:hypothetical protein CEUSTIGMA_g6477.t1 [Chlamydomonas eustigma]|uniref:Uroporphyrinogen-III synthase n=1 Tax=Chlamydomonas eustigma TaxID=1157962 RepID=A0A250X7J4_9CHLO|nr:hypothetical protein CEUSTIGMA_g6477.t1 [Chlamydomonas eustigma]|eukprot:GAX79037.1 hypothetical protein CEUSTIGMA_g6477.t1 [Chlamydomonas eustigma]
MIQSRTYSESLHKLKVFRQEQRKGRFRIVTSSSARVLLTREAGKNDKMSSGLSKLGLQCIELPLIEHSDGPERHLLPAALQSSAYDWVAITSPEAATVFLEAWNEAGKPNVRIAVVGAGTGEILNAAGVVPEFTATKATGTVMGAELPKVPGGNATVLYPSSAKASTDLQNALTENGYTVTRMNTYNTSGVINVEPEVLQQALTADIVTFGSPSAVKAWVQLVGLEVARSRLSVCIGSTSARACDAVGLSNESVLYPESPGIEGWLVKVQEAVHRLQVTA